MGWRYRRRLRLAPGLWLNLGKTGITSVSAGVRGARLTWGRRGRRASVGLPGSGISYTSYEPHRRRPASTPPAPPPQRESTGFGMTAAVAVAILAVLALVFWSVA